MKHADSLVERILFLEGVPNVAAYDKISVGATVKQQLENDLGLEQAALTVLQPGIKTCLDTHDDATRELLEHIVVDEEHHIDWIESQFHQIKEVGYENYLSQQIFKKARRLIFAAGASRSAVRRTISRYLVHNVIPSII
jgi:bacterioferritin